MNTNKHGFLFENLNAKLLDETAIIQFCRPEIKNPLSVKTLEELKEIFTFFESASEIKTIIFTGSGDTFASGANLNEVAQLSEKTAIEFGLRGQNLMQKIFNSSKNTIAAIDGFCMGGALDLALSCKKRIASEKSVFAHPGANLGIITGWGGTQLLPRLIGKKRAFEILLTAKRASAEEALKIGLIDELCENPLEKAIANHSQ
jgi:enoyl-CoA hydratase/carnithine racemase